MPCYWINFPRLLAVSPEILTWEGSSHPLFPLQLAGCLSQATPTHPWKFQIKLKTFSAWRNQTTYPYESAWCLWCSWCDDQQILSPFCLCSGCAKGKEYQTIYVYRSAVSTTLLRLEGISVGQHTLVIQVMNFQKKPPKFSAV